MALVVAPRDLQENGKTHEPCIRLAGLPTHSAADYVQYQERLHRKSHGGFMRVLVLLSAAIVMSVPLSAQRGLEMPTEYKEVQIRKLEAQHRLLRAMADSMPEGLYRDAATADQRDFAEQLHHATSSMVFIAARYVLDVSPPFTPDTSRILNNKTEAVAYIDEAFGWAKEQLRNQQDGDRSVNVSLFGQNMAKWQVWDEIHQHTIWTAGAMVANFRKHGMAPPGYSLF